VSRNLATLKVKTAHDRSGPSTFSLIFFINTLERRNMELVPLDKLFKDGHFVGAFAPKISELVLLSPRNAGVKAHQRQLTSQTYEKSVAQTHSSC